MIGQDKLADERKKRMFAEYAASEPLSNDEAAEIEAHVSKVLATGLATAQEALIARDVATMLDGPMFKGIRKGAAK